MVSIDVGATTITHSTGASTVFQNEATPHDLLKRVADDAPYVSVSEHGCVLHPAHTLYAEAVASALREQQLGDHAEPPVAVAVPGWWAPRALARVRDALGRQGLNVLLVNDAEAAITECVHSGHELPDTVAVLSLRAEQSSVVIVRSCNEKPTALLSPTQVHDEGGVALDTAVLQHLVRGLTGLGELIDTSDPDTIVAARSALPQARALREALSTTATESVSPQLPGVSQAIRIVRSELEELAAPLADAIIGLLKGAIEQSDEPVGAVLLTGGLAAMPLISQRVSADLSLDVIVPDAPRLVVARGAQRILEQHTQPTRGRFARRFAFLRPRHARTRPTSHAGAPVTAALELGSLAVSHASSAQDRGRALPMNDNAAHESSADRGGAGHRGDARNSELEALLSSIGHTHTAPDSTRATNAQQEHEALGTDTTLIPAESLASR